MVVVVSHPCQYSVRRLQRTDDETSWTGDLARAPELGRLADETAQQRVDSALLDEPMRREEGPVQRQVTGRYRLVGLVEPRQHRLNERVAEPERSAGELVGRARVDRRVVARVGADQPIHGRAAEQLRQPVRVRDVLDLSADHLQQIVGLVNK